MAKYTMVCDVEHDEPMTFTVEADNDDEAMDMMLDELRPHLDELHGDMAGKSEDELKEMVMSKWTKEGEGEMASDEKADSDDDDAEDNSEEKKDDSEDGDDEDNEDE